MNCQSRFYVVKTASIVKLYSSNKGKERKIKKKEVKKQQNKSKEIKKKSKEKT